MSYLVGFQGAAQCMTLLFQRNDPPSTVRGRMYGSGLCLVENQSLPTDSIGIVTLTFSGVKPGSELHIFSNSGVELAGTESVVGSPSFVLPYYSAGSANNNVRVLVASLAYENVDLAYTLTSASSTIPIFQRIDRNYRNP